MCGKFTRMATWAEVVEYSSLIPARSPVTDSVPVQMVTPAGRTSVVSLDENGERVALPMIWGFTDRASEGRRQIRHMHARGETIDRLPTWSEAFRMRRGAVWADTFNEGEEVPVHDSAGQPTGRSRTRQWTYRRRDGRPIILGVLYDVFDVGRGKEREFAMVTTAAGGMVERITDRMPLILSEADLPAWLGELRAPLDDVMALLRPCEIDEAEWEGAPQPARNGGGARSRTRKQGDLFG